MTGDQIGGRPALAGPAAQPTCPAPQAQGDTPKLLFTVEEAAVVLGVGRTTVFGLLRDGQLDSVRIGTSRRIAMAALEAYVARLSAGDGHVGDRPAELEPTGDGEGTEATKPPCIRQRDRRLGHHHRSRAIVEVLALPFAGEVTPAST